MSNRDMHLVRLGEGRCGHPVAEKWVDVRKRPVESSSHSRKEREEHNQDVVLACRKMRLMFT
jgi:hypothetical protein